MLNYIVLKSLLLNPCSVKSAFKSLHSIPLWSSSFFNSCLCLVYLRQWKKTWFTLSTWLQLSQVPVRCFPMGCRDGFSFVCPSLILLIRHSCFSPATSCWIWYKCLPLVSLSQSFCHCVFILLHIKAFASIFLTAIATSTWFLSNPLI